MLKAIHPLPTGDRLAIAVASTGERRPHAVVVLQDGRAAFGRGPGMIGAHQRVWPPRRAHPPAA